MDILILHFPLFKYVVERSSHCTQRSGRCTDREHFSKAYRTAFFLAGNDDLASRFDLGIAQAFDTADSTIHIDNIGVAFSSKATVTTCLINVMRDTFASNVGHGIGELYFTADLNSADLTRNVETVAFAQYDVVVAAGVSQCLVEFDAYHIGIGNIEFGERNRVAACAHAGHGNGGVALGYFFFIHLTDETATAYIGRGGKAAGTFNEVGEAFVFLLKGVTSGEDYFTANFYTVLFLIAGATANFYHVVRIEDEAGGTVNDETVFQCKGEGFA